MDIVCLLIHSLDRFLRVRVQRVIFHKLKTKTGISSKFFWEKINFESDTVSILFIDKHIFLIPIICVSIKFPSDFVLFEFVTNYRCNLKVTSWYQIWELLKSRILLKNCIIWSYIIRVRRHWKKQTVKNWKPDWRRWSIFFSTSIWDIKRSSKANYFHEFYFSGRERAFRWAAIIETYVGGAKYWERIEIFWWNRTRSGIRNGIWFIEIKFASATTRSSNRCVSNFFVLNFLSGRAPTCFAQWFHFFFFFVATMRIEGFVW